MHDYICVYVDRCSIIWAHLVSAWKHKSTFIGRERITLAMYTVNMKDLDPDDLRSREPSSKSINTRLAVNNLGMCGCNPREYESFFAVATGGNTMGSATATYATAIKQAWTNENSGETGLVTAYPIVLSSSYFLISLLLSSMFTHFILYTWLFLQ